MAVFSNQHNLFLLPSPSFSNGATSLKMCDTPTNFFSQFYPPEPNYLGYGVDLILPGNDTSSPRKQSSDSSTVVDKVESGEQVTPDIKSKEEKRKKRNASFSCSVQFKNKPERKGMKQKKRKEEKKNEKEVPEEAQTDYIHVRARRGQATDSHSLAERVRREKISERMKMLQRLVPGCDKVIGKALVLDEIINYVQSLQNQVELLSIKLSSVNQLSYQFENHLDSFMLTPESMSSSMASSNLQQSSGFSSHVSAFSHLLMDHSPSILVDQGDKAMPFSVKIQSRSFSYNRSKPQPLILHLITPDALYLSVQKLSPASSTSCMGIMPKQEPVSKQIYEQYRQPDLPII